MDYLNQNPTRNAKQKGIYKRKKRKKKQNTNFVTLTFVE